LVTFSCTNPFQRRAPSEQYRSSPLTSCLGGHQIRGLRRSARRAAAAPGSPPPDAGRHSSPGTGQKRQYKSGRFIIRGVSLMKMFQLNGSNFLRHLRQNSGRGSLARLGPPRPGHRAVTVTVGFTVTRAATVTARVRLRVRGSESESPRPARNHGAGPGPGRLRPRAGISGHGSPSQSARVSSCLVTHWQCHRLGGEGSKPEFTYSFRVRLPTRSHCNPPDRTLRLFKFKFAGGFPSSSSSTSTKLSTRRDSEFRQKIESD
jgi:hypothetical protein